MACGTLARGVKREPKTLVEGAGIYPGDKGKKGTLGVSSGTWQHWGTKNSFEWLEYLKQARKYQGQGWTPR